MTPTTSAVSGPPILRADHAEIVAHYDLVRPAVERRVRLLQTIHRNVSAVDPVRARRCDEHDHIHHLLGGAEAAHRKTVADVVLEIPRVDPVKTQVRRRLPGGGRRIRTLGPACLARGFAGAGSSTFLSTSALPKIARALRTPTGELSDDRSVELADPKWPQGAHCARRARPRIQGDPGQYRRRRQSVP